MGKAAFTPTDEQIAIIDAARTENDLKVIALAGNRGHGHRRGRHGGDGGARGRVDEPPGVHGGDRYRR